MQKQRRLELEALTRALKNNATRVNKMGREPLNTTINDDFGAPHVYFSVPHPGTEGLLLQNKLQKALVPALSAIRPEGLAGLTSDASGASDAHVLAQGLGAVQGVFAEALTIMEPKIIKSLLRHTTRDGLTLNQEINFDVAYQGNYGELYVACWEVARLNFGPAVERLMGNARMASLQAVLKQVTGQQEKSPESLKSQASQHGQHG